MHSMLFLLLLSSIEMNNTLQIYSFQTEMLTHTRLRPIAFVSILQIIEIDEPFKIQSRF